MARDVHLNDAMPREASGSPVGRLSPARSEVSMPKSWSKKRERQYEHIKESYRDRGVSKDEAEERAARTVNRERREEGETSRRGKKG